MSGTRAINKTLPNWTLCALFNSDTTGNTDQEIEEIDQLSDDLNQQGFNAIPVDHIDIGFCHTNDLDQMAGDCSLLTFHTL
jgi:hypothetical protein